MLKLAGDEILGDKMNIPGVRIYIKCKDSEGNYFSLLHPSERT